MPSTAIRTMIVRGAPLIGAPRPTAWRSPWPPIRPMPIWTAPTSVLLASRPTAVNLRWALDDLRALLAPLPPAQRREAAYRRAAEICDEDVEICRRIGENGLAEIKRLDAAAASAVNVLTHCNAGWLATVDWGTALSPIYHAARCRHPDPRLGRRDAAAQPGRQPDRLGARPSTACRTP